MENLNQISLFLHSEEIDVHRIAPLIQNRQLQETVVSGLFYLAICLVALQHMSLTLTWFSKSFEPVSFIFVYNLGKGAHDLEAKQQ